MTSSVFVVFLVAMISVTVMADDPKDVITDYKPYEETWELFKKDFGRSYSSREEENLRYQAFLKNVQMMERHNTDYMDKKVTFAMDINQFTDHLDHEGLHGCHVDEDWEDLEDTRRYKRQTGFCRLFSPPTGYTPPQSKDWREDGVVTPVGNQGKCGSCYAFGVTTTIAAQQKLSIGGTLTPLSEQQLVDCFKKDCNGSNAESTFRYVRENGIAAAADYPYTSQTRDKGKPGNCKGGVKVSARVSGCQYSLKNEANLLYMVAQKGPVYASITVSPSFQDYRTGIYSQTGEKSRGRHCVTVIGYGHDDQSEKDYWIIKNSWATSWGEHGYGRIERGRNMCGIGDRNTVPEVSEATSINDGSTVQEAGNAISINDVTFWPSWLLSFSSSVLFLAGHDNLIHFQ